MSLSATNLKQYAARHRSRFEAMLKEAVEIPSISADPARRGDIERVAEWAVSQVRRLGGEASLYRVKGGNPLVHARFQTGSNRPTVTVYNHLDVQPASKQTEPWRTEPFRFTRRGDTYFGRGATDDKGPALTALFGARAALEAGVPVNIQFLWETEEEIGSPNFAATLKKVGAAAATDGVVVSDTVWVSRGRPSMSVGLRGLQRFIFRLQTAETDQHSGVTGGAARNPVAELCQLAADIADLKTGRVRIPGFYADVAKLTRQQLADFRAAGFDVARFKRDHGFRSLRSNDALDLVKRIWAQPTFEVHGLVGGYTGPGVKTVVPPSAELKTSFRLVPDMQPARVIRLVTAFVKKRHPDVEIETGSSAEPFKGRTSGPWVEAVQRSMKFAFGKKPVLVREGGSIGAVLSMERILRVPVVFMGLSLPDHGYHAPNENYDWGQASGGIVAFARLFEELAVAPRRAPL